jgi:predicted  nucleic acid-binding Zn-ribbon protein
MSQEVVQWLNEIKALQQEVSDLKQALTEADRRLQEWQNRYEVEARQRRQDGEQQERAIAVLTQEIDQLKAAPQLALAQADAAVTQQIDALANFTDLKAKLAEVWASRDRALESLQQEQAAHQRTRQDLTMALADAMDTLKQLREKT